MSFHDLVLYANSLPDQFPSYAQLIERLRMNVEMHFVNIHYHSQVSFFMIDARQPPNL